MAAISAIYTRIEPQPNEVALQEGFTAPIADPYWLLARQWQMGEFQGENASSPVFVKYTLNSDPIEWIDPNFDPGVTPAEAIVESEIDDWWTMGRRIRMGERLAKKFPLAVTPDCLLVDPPPPYEHFAGRVDGLAFWKRLPNPAASFPAVPKDSIPAWHSEQFIYEQEAANSFSTEGKRLTVKRHRGDRLDWYSVDGFNSPAAVIRGTVDAQVIPATFTYPGAPASRWWEFENAEVDPGTYVPDRAHSVTAILTELVASHSDDWFLFPVMAKAGNRIAIEQLEVHDSFGRKYSSETPSADPLQLWQWPGLHPPENWSLFAVDGLEANELLLWNVAERPLESLPIERVQIGIDEQMNLMWAVERIIDSRETGHGPGVAENPSPPLNEGKPSGDATREREYTYVPARGIAPFWHPYLNAIDDAAHMFIQHRLPELSHRTPGLMPLPEALVLQSDVPDKPHQIAPRAIPSDGIEVERRWYLARDLNGKPVLWIGRRRVAMLAPPARMIRFDVMEESLNQV